MPSDGAPYMTAERIAQRCTRHLNRRRLREKWYARLTPLAVEGFIGGSATPLAVEGFIGGSATIWTNLLYTESTLTDGLDLITSLVSH